MGTVIEDVVLRALDRIQRNIVALARRGVIDHDDITALVSGAADVFLDAKMDRLHLKLREIEDEASAAADEPDAIAARARRAGISDEEN